MKLPLDWNLARGDGIAREHSRIYICLFAFLVGIIVDISVGGMDFSCREIYLILKWISITK